MFQLVILDLDVRDNSKSVLSCVCERERERERERRRNALIDVMTGRTNKYNCCRLQ